MSRSQRFLAPFGRDYAAKVLSVETDSLIGYWPLWEGSGTLAQSQSTYRGEFLVNGGFETAGAGGADIWGTWAETAGDGALADEATLFYAGAKACKQTAGATANTKVAQTITVRPGCQYDLSFYTRGDGTYGGRYLVYDVTNAANIIAATATGVTGTTYTQVSVSFVTPAACVSIRIDLMCPSTNTGICYFDAVSLLGRLHGTSVGVTLSEPGIGDGRTSYYFDGSLDYVNVYSAALAAAFNGAEGALLVGAKVANAGVWTDGVSRFCYRLRGASDNDQISIVRSSGNNALAWTYRGQATTLSRSLTTSSLTFMFLALVWSATGGYVRAYSDGVQVGADLTLALPWTESLGSAWIGAAWSTPVQVWSGWLAHCALWSKALTPAQIAYVGKV